MNHGRFARLPGKRTCWDPPGGGGGGGGGGGAALEVESDLCLFFGIDLCGDILVDLGLGFR